MTDRTARREMASASVRTFSIATAAVGALIVWRLTVYNLQPYALWSTAPQLQLRTWEEYLLVNITGLILLPSILHFLWFRTTPQRMGFGPASRYGWRAALWALAAMLPVLIVAARFPAFQAYYPIQPMAGYSWRYLLYFELTYGAYMLAWEWFYRGFLTFGLARGFGPTAAVVTQAAAFCVMHYGKPPAEMAGSFIAGIALGILALRGRSFLPCFALHWTISVLFDLLVLAWRPGGLSPLRL